MPHQFPATRHQFLLAPSIGRSRSLLEAEFLVRLDWVLLYGYVDGVTLAWQMVSPMVIAPPMTKPPGGTGSPVM